MLHNHNTSVLRRLFASIAKEHYYDYNDIWCPNVNNTTQYEEYHLYGYQRPWWYCFLKTKFLLAVIIVDYEYNTENIQKITKVKIHTAGYPSKMKNIIDLMKKLYLDDIPVELDFYSDKVEEY